MRHSIHDFLLYSKTTNLSISQLRSLYQFHHTGASITAIGEMLGVTSAAASQLVERLVNQGLIVRTEDLHDRRVRQIVLTEKGLHTLEEGFHSLQLWLNDLIDLLTPEEQTQVTTALQILIGKTSQLEKISSQPDICLEQSPS